MPLYEYLCAHCGHRFERIVKFSDPPLTKCPECGGEIEQMISAPAVQFKGSGFYQTDYKKSSGGDSGSKSGGESVKASDGTASAGKASESKGAESSVLRWNEKNALAKWDDLADFHKVQENSPRDLQASWAGAGIIPPGDLPGSGLIAR